MDNKSVALAVLALVVVAGGVYVLTSRPAAAESSTAPAGSGGVDANGEPLPETRVVNVLERLYTIGRGVYDDVQARGAQRPATPPAQTPRR